MPAPVNIQLEEALEASPPWDQITAGNEEYEEYEEYEEEEGYEDVAWYRKSGNEQETGHVEGGLLYQPLEEHSGYDNLEPTVLGSRLPIAGGCPSTKDPCYKHVGKKSGRANEGGTGSCRSGGSRNKKGKCQAGQNKKESAQQCTDEAGAEAAAGPIGVAVPIVGAGDAWAGINTFVKCA